MIIVSEMKETSITDYVWRLACVFGLYVAGVQLLLTTTRGPVELPVELSVSDVYRVNLHGPGFEQAVRESAGGSADIDRNVPPGLCRIL
jgi:hypothetical protein